MSDQAITGSAAAEQTTATASEPSAAVRALDRLAGTSRVTGGAADGDVRLDGGRALPDAVLIRTPRRNDHG